MTSLCVEISNFQHLRGLRVSIDLAAGLNCFVGRNGVGKTTLVRALRNLGNADTFIKSASPHAINQQSTIVYRIGDEVITFTYDPALRSLNCRQEIPADIRGLVSAELPLPHGRRFNFHRSASDADAEIREALALGAYRRPNELIGFLESIYGDHRFEDLLEIEVRGQFYYAIPRADNRYIREDYLSSGEYFLINLYRTLTGGARLIVVDEIDISLDAAAQVKVATWLREFCRRYDCALVFTTHSLPLMSTLENGELRFLDIHDGIVTDRVVSYGYVKARLFGFVGWDRYLLTEDIVLAGFIRHLIALRCSGGLLRHLVVHVGGASQVVDLMRRNALEQFLSSADAVAAILDGDQLAGYGAAESVHCVPFDSVEKAILIHSTEAEFPFTLPANRVFGSPKELYNYLISSGSATPAGINQYLCDRYTDALGPLVGVIREFLVVQ